MNYNDDLTSKLIDICEKEKANKSWFWLVHVFGNVKKGYMCIIESGNKLNVTEYTKENFDEKAIEFANKIPTEY